MKKPLKRGNCQVKNSRKQHKHVAKLSQNRFNIWHERAANNIPHTRNSFDRISKKIKLLPGKFVKFKRLFPFSISHFPKNKMCVYLDEKITSKNKLLSSSKNHLNNNNENKNFFRLYCKHYREKIIQKANKGGVHIRHKRNFFFHFLPFIVL